MEKDPTRLGARSLPGECPPSEARLLDTGLHKHRPKAAGLPAVVAEAAGPCPEILLSGFLVKQRSNRLRSRLLPMNATSVRPSVVHEQKHGTDRN